MYFWVTKIVTFDAAHYLEFHKGKCQNLHGHTWRLEVSVLAPADDYGITIDFSELKIELEKIISEFDHKLLNDKVKNPTAENLVLYISEKLKENDFFSEYSKFKLVLWESASSCVSVEFNNL